MGMGMGTAETSRLGGLHPRRWARCRAARCRIIQRIRRARRRRCRPRLEVALWIMEGIRSPRRTLVCPLRAHKGLRERQQRRVHHDPKSCLACVLCSFFFFFFVSYRFTGCKISISSFSLFLCNRSMSFALITRTQTNTVSPCTSFHSLLLAGSISRITTISRLFFFFF